MDAAKYKERRLSKKARVLNIHESRDLLGVIPEFLAGDTNLVEY
jgi:hypothetical protein